MAKMIETVSTSKALSRTFNTITLCTKLSKRLRLYFWSELVLRLQSAILETEFTIFVESNISTDQIRRLHHIEKGSIAPSQTKLANPKLVGHNLPPSGACAFFPKQRAIYAT